MQEKFNKIIAKHEVSLKSNNKVFKYLGYLRLFFVLSLVPSLYFVFKSDYENKFVLLCIGIIAILIGLWIFYNKVNEKIEFAEGNIEINKRHVDRISGKWIEFLDVGEEFIDSDHPYAGDLDAVGKKSLFQLLNVTHTWHGRQAFAGDLLNPNYTKEQIEERQKGISELSKDIEFLNQVEYHTSKIKADDSIKEFIAELQYKKKFVKNKAIKFTLYYFPWLSLIFIISMIIFKLKEFYMAGAIIAAIQGVVWLIGMPKTLHYLGMMNQLPKIFKDYRSVIKMVNEREFESSQLREIKSILSASNTSAEQALKDLDKIGDRLSVRSNFIFCFVLNVFGFWDYKCAFMFEDWKAKYANFAEDWFVALGEFESLMSFSLLGVVCSNVCMPTILNDRKKLEAKSIGHPLLINESRINNDIVFQDRIFIISGSNMSGKTTFLRTVGINLLLAQCGSFVCAEKMQCFPMKIITSMRIADDLNEGISTFYAELKRIKGILELANKEQNMIFLIDEIFRGTNSVDRLCGAKIVIAKLDELKAVGILTTHDLELCQLEGSYERIENYSFSEDYIEGNIHFDYKIKEGKSTTTNAKYLMEMVGII